MEKKGKYLFLIVEHLMLVLIHRFCYTLTNSAITCDYTTVYFHKNKKLCLKTEQELNHEKGSQNTTVEQESDFKLGPTLPYLLK